MKILLKATALNEYVDGANCLLLELTDELKKELLAQRELFQMVQAKAKGLHALTFWSIPGEFFDVDEDSLKERLGTLASKFEIDECVVVPDDFTVYGFAFSNLMFDDDEPDEEDEVGGVRTEIDLTLITANGVYFRAALKNSSTYVESGVLPFELLLSKEK